jgi:hypothetical protein
VTLAFKLAIGELFSELLCTYHFYLPSCKHLQRWNNVLNTARPKLSGAGQLPSLLVLRCCHCEHVFTNLNNWRWTMQMNEGKSTCLMQNINLQNEWCLQLWYGRLATVSFYWTWSLLWPWFPLPARDPKVWVLKQVRWLWFQSSVSAIDCD